jgi:hypothetical protein
MVWLGWLVAGLSLQVLWFAPTSVYVGFVLEKLALGYSFV